MKKMEQQLAVVASVLVVVVVAFVADVVADVVAGAAAFVVVVDVKAIATLYVGPVRLT